MSAPVMSLEGLSEDDLRAILQRAGVEAPADAPRKVLAAQIKKRGLNRRPQDQPPEQKQSTANVEAGFPVSKVRRLWRALYLSLTLGDDCSEQWRMQKLFAPSSTLWPRPRAFLRLTGTPG